MKAGTWCWWSVMAAVGLVFAGSPALVRARDLADGWLLGPAATAEFLAGHALEPGGVWATTGQSRLFGVASLPVMAVQAGLSLAQWPGRPSVETRWQTLGEGLFSEDTYEIHGQVGRRPVVGLAYRTVRTQTGGFADIARQADSRWQAALTIQAQWSLPESVRVQARLWLPAAEGGANHEAEGRRPLARIQGWNGALALAVAVDLKADQSPAVSLEWDLGWGGGACGMRVDLATGIVGPVVQWRRGLLLIRTSHLVHPQLGVTHHFELGLGAWGAPRW